MKQGITKAELARQLGVSRAYITMIANGKRKPSEDIVNKLNSLSFDTNQIVNKTEANSLTLNQQVTGSTPVRLISKLKSRLVAKMYVFRPYDSPGNSDRKPICIRANDCSGGHRGTSSGVPAFMQSR